MLGVIVNTLAIVVGGLVGILCKKGFSKKLTDAIMIGVALCIVYIGISGSLKGEDTLVLVVSMVVGTVVGTLLDLDRGMTRLGEWVERKLKHENGEGVTVAEGFVTAGLLFCVGAMAVIGSLNAGLKGDNEMLFTKALLDMISAMMLATSLGIGVVFSAGLVLIYQGAIVVLAQFLAPILTEATIAELSCAGSLLILALGLNMLGITKIKVANYLPVLIVVPLFCQLFEWIMP